MNDKKIGSKTKSMSKNYSIGLACVCLITWIISSSEYLTNMIVEYRGYLISAGLIIIAIVICVWKDSIRELSFEDKVYLILMLGFIIRAVYVIVSPYDISKHDLGNFSLAGDETINSGHLGYISYLYNYKKLPDFDPRIIWAFYNPPFFHIVSAVWYAFNQFIGLSEIASIENLQILTLAFSCGSVIIGYKILCEVFPKNKWMLMLVGIMSSFPFFTILSAMLSNDALATLLSMSAILYTIRWYRNRTYRNIVYVALSIGLGMLTKLNVALLALGIGFLFLWVLITKKSEFIKNFIQLSVFACISFPIGLFWSLRNFILYRIPFFYIQSASSAQYISNQNIFERIKLPGLQLLKYPFLKFDVSYEYNIWAQLGRTSLFDEIKPPDTIDFKFFMSLSVLWVTLLIVGISILLFLRMVFWKKYLALELKIFFSLIFSTLLGSFTIFCFTYPNICTMNFRYIVPIILLPLLSLGGYFNEEIIKIDNKTSSVFQGFLVGLLCYLIVGFLLVQTFFTIWAPFRY